MKKLSDYRIREENGKFVIQVKETTITRRFLLKNLIKEDWISASLFYSKLSEDGGLVACKDVFDTLEAAKSQIIKWCEEPKYHYVVADYSIRELPNFAIGKKRYKVQSAPIMDIPYSVVMEAISCELLGWDVIGKTEHKMKEENGGIITFYRSKYEFEKAKQQHKEFLEKKEKERKSEESIKKAQEIADAAIKIINDFAKTEQQMKEEITEKECVDAIKKQFDEKFIIPLTFEAKNMELQLENARLKGIIETLTAKKK